MIALVDHQDYCIHIAYVRIHTHIIEVSNFDSTNIYYVAKKSWQHVECHGDLPYARFGHTSVKIGSRIFIFGGCGSRTQEDDDDDDVSHVEQSSDDLFQLDTDTMRWTLLKTDGCCSPPSMHSHTCVVDKDNNLLIFGGYRHDVGLTNELWSYSTDGSRWNLIHCRSESGSIPSPREMHASIYCHDNFKMYVMGGRTHVEEALDVCPDLWCFDIRTFLNIFCCNVDDFFDILICISQSIIALD